MANNNVQNIKFLRNGNVFTPSIDPVKTARQVALDAMEKQKANLADGTAILGRYQETNGDVKTLVGFAYVNGETKTLTVFDVDGAGADVDKKIKTAIEALDSNATSLDGKNVQVKVTEEDGKIKAVNITTDNTVNSGDVASAIKTEIDKLNKAASAEDGKVVTTISENDGVVSEVKANVKDLQLGGYSKDTSATGDIASTDTINAALSKLENKASAITIANADGSIKVTTSATGTDINVNIKSGEKVIKKDGNGGLYTGLDLVKIEENLPTNVKERYQLLASNDSQIGANIDIYKDSSISKIYLGYSNDTVDENTGVITSGTTGEPQSLNYVYHKEDDKYEMVHVDVSKFLVESEFASGVTADTNGVVHGVVGTNSETNSSGTAFLTVDADGFKVNGIKQEIIDRINGLDATVSGETTDGKVNVKVTEANGLITAVDVVGTDIASASALAAEIAARKNVDGQDGDTYTANANTNYIGDAGSLNDADIKLDAALKALDDKINNITIDCGTY